MGTIRQLKRKKETAIPSVDKRFLEATFNRGFDDGAKAQREADIMFVVELMEGLESIPGIGKATADKVREYFKTKLEGGKLGG